MTGSFRNPCYVFFYLCVSVCVFAVSFGKEVYGTFVPRKYFYVSLPGSSVLSGGVAEGGGGKALMQPNLLHSSGDSFLSMPSHKTEIFVRWACQVTLYWNSMCAQQKRVQSPLWSYHSELLSSISNSAFAIFDLLPGSPRRGLPWLPSQGGGSHRGQFGHLLPEGGKLQLSFFEGQELITSDWAQM